MSKYIKAPCLSCGILTTMNRHGLCAECRKVSRAKELTQVNIGDESQASIGSGSGSGSGYGYGYGDGDGDGVGY